jgi:hypothetical protein
LCGSFGRYGFSDAWFSSPRSCTKCTKVRIFLFLFGFIELNFSLRDLRVLRGRYFTTRNPEEPFYYFGFTSFDRAQDKLWILIVRMPHPSSGIYSDVGDQVKQAWRIRVVGDWVGFREPSLNTPVL